MTASLFSAPSMVCARCHGQMVITKDALQRERFRCPRCDGIARHVRVHPDEVLVPVALTASSQLLPPIEPGQLRCQVCARGVTGTERMHPECARARKLGQMTDSRARRWAPRTCQKCGGALPKKVGRPRKFCERCA